MSEAYRMPGVERATGYRPPTIYMKIRDGLFPEPVRLSKRHSIWPSHEIDAWLAAKARGATDDEIKQLVKQLISQRQTNAA